MTFFFFNYWIFYKNVNCHVVSVGLSTKVYYSSFEGVPRVHFIDRRLGASARAALALARILPLCKCIYVCEREALTNINSAIMTMRRVAIVLDVIIKRIIFLLVNI